jgi:hypothetical protein
VPDPPCETSSQYVPAGMVVVPEPVNSAVGWHAPAAGTVGILYPEWWQGRRFDEPTEGWVCGTTSESTRDIVQLSLLRRPSDIGSGMIRPNAIVDIQRRPYGLRDSREQILVKHKWAASAPSA